MIYSAIIDIIDKDKFLNQNQQSRDYQKAALKVIKVSANIQALIIEGYFKGKANGKFLEQISKDKEALTLRKSSQKKKTLTELQSEITKLWQIEEKIISKFSEEEQLFQLQQSGSKIRKAAGQKGSIKFENQSSDDDEDSFLERTTCTTDDSEEYQSYYSKHPNRTIEDYLSSLKNKLSTVNTSNKQFHKKLNQKVQREVKEGKLIYFENQCDNPESITSLSQNSKKAKKNLTHELGLIEEDYQQFMVKFGGFQKELGKDPRLKMNEKEISKLHMDYLQSLIYRLEEKQVADSISKITNCRRDAKHSHKHFSFEVHLEDALNAQPTYIDLQTLIRFNQYRENSLLKQYNLSLKTLFTSTSHNSRNQQNIYRDADVLSVMKQHPNIHHDSQHNQILNQTRNFDICHHCRQLFDLGYLIKCCYRSSVMGMPSSNQSNNETIFISSHGELVCNRKYCLNCLKQNYEYKHEHHSKIDWVCPFCQGYCYCIRCLRNEIINKLKGIFLLYGGDIQNLEQESLLSKYIKTLSEEDRKRKERDDYCNRKVNSSLIAQKVQKETYEKDVKLEKDLSYTLEQLTEIRFDMERVRLLVSQVCKREKIKNKVTNQDLLIQMHREKLLHNQKLKQQRTQTPPTANPGKRGRKPSLVKSPTKPLSKKELKALLKKQGNEGDDISNSSDLEVEEDDDVDADADEDNVQIDGEDNDDEVDEELAEGDAEDDEEDNGDEEEGDEGEVVDDDDNEGEEDEEEGNEAEEEVDGDDEDQEEVEEEQGDENEAEEIEEEQEVDEDKSQLNSSDANDDEEEDDDNSGEKSNNSNTQRIEKQIVKSRDDQDDDDEEDDDEDDENYEESNSDDEEVVVVKRKNSNSDNEDSSDSGSTRLVHSSKRLGRRPVQSQVKNVIRVLQKGRKQQKKETRIKSKPKSVSKKIAKAIQKNKLKDAKNGRFVKSSSNGKQYQEPQVVVVVKKKKSKKTKEINDLMRHHDPAIIKLTKSKSKLLRSSAIKSSSKPLARKQTLSGAEFHIQKKSKN